MRRLLTSNLSKYTRWLEARKSKLSWDSYVKVGNLLNGFIQRMIVVSVAGRKSVSLAGGSVAFARTISSIYKHQGGAGVILYTKKCQLLLQQALCEPVDGPLCQPKPVRVSATAKGLPRCIPVVHRKLIRAGDTTIIQYWLTLFSLYRVLSMRSKWKVETIFGSIKGTREFQRKAGFNEFMPEFLKALRTVVHFHPIEWKWKPMYIRGTGPNSCENETSFLSSAKDAVAWRRNSLAKAFVAFCEETGMTEPLEHMFKASYMVAPHDVCQNSISIKFKNPFTPDGKKKKFTRETDPKELEFTSRVHYSPFNEISANGLIARLPALGKLAFKPEAAGKVRVFAILDYWTQTILKPLHKWLFGILRHINEDATFDQSGAIEDLKVRIGRTKSAYSYDLSAATDRLPLTIQVDLLGALLGNYRLASLWALLLVGRAYYVKRNPKFPRIPLWGRVEDTIPEVFRYSTVLEHAREEAEHILSRGELVTTNNKVVYRVGQPMGALSSWAMLAMTHHFLVQYSHYTVCMTQGKKYSWFKDYKVLGDDIVIYNPYVAEQYYKTMTQYLQVGINPAKSITSSNGTWEFAKCFIYRGVNVSPFSWSELEVARRALPALLGIFLKPRRTPNFSVSQLLRCFGYGYQIRSRLNSGYLNLMKRHPRVVPPLLFITFPDTSPQSLRDFAEWMRAFSLNHFVPDARLKGMAQRFYEDMITSYEFTVNNLVTTSTDALHAYPKAGMLAGQVLKEMSDILNADIRKVIRDAAAGLADVKEDISLQSSSLSESRQLNAYFDAFLDLTGALDSFPRWVDWDSRPDAPIEIDKVGKWVRFKYKSLMRLRKYDKL